MIKEAANIVFLFCQMGSPSIPENKKLDCMDYMINCIIVNGEIKNEKKCKENFNKGKRYEKNKY